MNIHTAVDKWLRRELTMLEVLAVTGEGIEQAYKEYMYIEADIAAAAHMMTSEEAERDELVDLAYQIYGDLLREEPGYLEQIIEGLQKQRWRDMSAFAARFNARRRGLSQRSNVIPFVRH